jgi:ATP-dependent exoDNAse (exonuclease V) beta subunit
MGDAERDGAEGAAAHRSLDAVVSLFDLASRSRDRGPRADLANLLAEVGAQEIPAGPLADAGVHGDGVRVMTAHRSKGLEWDVVVVAGVQADDWPDLRRRGSVLDTDLLGADGLRTPQTVSELRREERRLFYVAITRARRRVMCTAVETPSEDGRRPSPFLEDLGVDIVHETEAEQHPLTLTGVVSSLRRAASDLEQSPAMRQAAAERLARLAQEDDVNGKLIPTADPDQWWAVRPRSGAQGPDLSEGLERPVLHLSGSQLETLQRCPLQWYLGRRVKAEANRGAPAGFGGLLHALADAVAQGELPEDVGALVSALDDVWGQLPYPAAWEASQEHEAAVAAVERFLEWHTRARGRRLVATEEQFEAEFTVLDQVVRLSGRVDRLERDDDDQLVVVDFKTSNSVRTVKEVETDLQLATYRRLVAEAHEVTPSEVSAELVQLRHRQGKGSAAPKVQEHKPSTEADEALDGALERAVAAVTTGTFPAIPGKACNYCQFTIACPAQPAGQEVIA